MCIIHTCSVDRDSKELCWSKKAKENPGNFKDVVAKLDAYNMK